MITKRRTMAVALAVALFVLPLCLVPEPSAATPQDKSLQKDYALIFGTVWDKNDRPVYGVPIKIRRADQKKAKWQLISDHSGEFAQRVPPGTADYVVWADIKVPKGAQKPEKTVHIENDERVDIGLHLTE